MPHFYYYQRDLETGITTAHPWHREHFKEVGIATMTWMPLLEGYILVNKWNAMQPTQRYVFGVEV